jgi:hypothetical protein
MACPQPTTVDVVCIKFEAVRKNTNKMQLSAKGVKQKFGVTPKQLLEKSFLNMKYKIEKQNDYEMMDLLDNNIWSPSREYKFAFQDMLYHDDNKGSWRPWVRGATPIHMMWNPLPEGLGKVPEPGWFGSPDTKQEEKLKGRKRPISDNNDSVVLHKRRPGVVWGNGIPSSNYRVRNITKLFRKIGLAFGIGKTNRMKKVEPKKKIGPRLVDASKDMCLHLDPVSLLLT